VTVSATTAATTDRSDFRHVVASGAKVGVVTAVAVVVYLLVSRYLPAGLLREIVQMAVVLGFAVPTAFLPAYFVQARQTEGVAGAAAVGLLGTVWFMPIDIILLRPFKAYPWTWDAVGGGSTWWYLAIWWMLGTFTAWMGALVTAARYERGTPTMASLALPPVGVGVVVAVVGRVAGCSVPLAVTSGAGFLATLVLLAVAGLARKA
jgi:hypothetical protein